MTINDQILTVTFWTDKNSLAMGHGENTFYPTKFYVKRRSLKKVLAKVTQISEQYFKDCNVSEIKIQTAIAAQQEKERDATDE